MEVWLLLLLTAAPHHTEALAVETSRRAFFESSYARFAALTLSSPSVSFEDELRPLKNELFRTLPHNARIVELGPGPGANVEWLERAQPASYVAVEKNPFFARKQPPTESTSCYPRLEDVPSQSADALVATLVLCSIADAEAALGEIRRILRPGGQYFFLEHVRSDERTYAALQEAVRPLQSALADGCDPAKDTETLVRAHFRIDRVQRTTLDKFAFFPVSPVIAGVATPLR